MTTSVLAATAVRPTRRPPRVPIRRQHAQADCGVACLGMVLAHHGRDVAASALRERLPDGRDGHSAAALLTAARDEGLDGRGVRSGVGGWSTLRVPAIVHLSRGHFVVLEHADQTRARWVDPARGRVGGQLEELRAQASGLVLELWPTPTLVPRRRANALARPLAAVFTQRRLLGVGLGVGVVLLALSVTLPWITAVLVDRVIPAADTAGLRTVLAIVCALALGRALAVEARGRVLASLQTRVDRRIATQLIDHLLGLPRRFFATRQVGDLVARWSSLARVREALTHGGLAALLDATLVLLYLVVLLAFSPATAAIAVVTALAQLTVPVVTRRRRAELTAAALECDAQARAFQTRMLGGIETVKMLGAEQALAQRLREHVEAGLAAESARARFTARVDAIGEGLRALTPGLLLGHGAWLVITQQASLGAMLGATQLALAFLAPIAGITQAIASLSVATGHMDRLDDIWSAAAERSGGVRVDAGARITLQGVAYRPSSDAPPILDGIDLDLAAGEHLAIVGPTGAGKTTLARLLLGLESPTSGTLRVDGVSLDELDLQGLRRSAGVVPQQVALFDMDIAENISLGTSVTEPAAIEAAACAAQVHDEIAAMPLGYRTRVGDGGAALSGGQRQRIALARALLRRPRLLVLDEATSAIDPITERAITAACAELGCTTITISHRIDTVRRADRIVVLERGRVVEVGTHDELSRAGGLYARLIGADAP